MIGVIVGGRIWYMLFYISPDWIWPDPLALFRVWDGGMSFHGGLMGVLAAGWWWSRRHEIHFFDTIDFVAPLVPIGLGLGRIGNFINGELWGKYTGGGWGVIYPRALDRSARRPRNCTRCSSTGSSTMRRGIRRSFTNSRSKAWSCSSCSCCFRASHGRVTLCRACSR